MDKLKNTIKHYGLKQLRAADLDPDPICQFNSWLEEAFKTEPREPNAMTLATAGENNQVSARIMLLKEVNEDGFIFFSNYQSRKAEDLQHNNKAALVFWWPYGERQVRVEGSVNKISAAASDNYFACRGKESRLGAHASKQSTVISNRQQLDDSFEQLQQHYADKDEIPRPEYWGGYCLQPSAIEFWQGGSHRLHDRFRFEKIKNKWVFERLAP